LKKAVSIFGNIVIALAVIEVVLIGVAITCVNFDPSVVLFFGVMFALQIFY